MFSSFQIIVLISTLARDVWGSPFSCRIDPVNNMGCCTAKDNRSYPYNTKTQFCCYNATLPVLEKASHLCRGTDVIEKQPDLTQCGYNLVYNTTKESCFYINGFYSVRPIDQLVTPGIIEIICDSTQPRCCAGAFYSEAQLCLPSGEIIDKKSADHNDGCSGISFNNQYLQCVNGKIVPNSPELDIACDSSTPSSAETLCCNGVLNIGYGHGGKCCGVTAYMPDQTVCCQGFAVHPKQKDYRCEGALYEKASPETETKAPVTEDVLTIQYLRIKKIRKSQRSGRIRARGTLMHKDSPDNTKITKRFTLKLEEDNDSLKRGGVYILIAGKEIDNTIYTYNKNTDNLLKLSRGPAKVKKDQIRAYERAKKSRSLD